MGNKIYSHDYSFIILAQSSILTDLCIIPCPDCLKKPKMVKNTSSKRLLPIIQHVFTKEFIVFNWNLDHLQSSITSQTH